MLYVAHVGDAVFVLHAFQKKTRQTAKRELDLAASRLARIREDDDGTSEF